MNETAAPSRSKFAVLWLLRIVVAAVFLVAAWMKLSGNTRMIEEFDMLGIGQWFRYATAIIEGLGAIALITPAVSPIGALILLFVDAGAFLSQVAVLHNDWIHAVVLAFLLLTILYLQRSQIRKSLSFAHNA